MSLPMNESGNSASRAGGSIIAGTIIAGAIGGTILGQPSIGFLVGTAVGVAIALLIWLKDRRG